MSKALLRLRSLSDANQHDPFGWGQVHPLGSLCEPHLRSVEPSLEPSKPTQLELIVPGRMVFEQAPS